ncbi:uncharacterized protein [Lepeophtheirus salmonis]|uniref:uncharacterized protein isoform X4 n=2 Tax=Lepeophtheirus salmonis TaxID=72036 RepID=UPI001AE1F63F|nr:centromere-associated protein E-like isoform X4 [Lepeophtheirus salmonis]
MYSPSSSPRKGPFGSNKGSPRKNLLSPSDVTPFSWKITKSAYIQLALSLLCSLFFNGPDGLNIFGNELLSQTNGIIPMSVPMDRRKGDGGGCTVGDIPLSRRSNLNQNSASRPRTQSLIPLGKSHSVGSGGIQRIRPTGSAGGEGSLGGILSGKSVREYDETLRDLQRDNFNLKLRIYFLEERMGHGDGINFSSDKNSEDSMIELKMTCERLKYDINEKSELLQEARFAIEDLENQLHNVSEKREKEKKSMEEKLKSLECELKDACNLTYRLNNNNNIPSKRDPSNHPSFFNSPVHKRVVSSGEEFGDSDDSLLREVEIEMRRKVNFEGPIGLPLPVVLENKEKEEVVGRQQELEDNVERLNKVIKETDKCLRNAQNVVAARVVEIEGLKSQLQDRDTQIHDMKIMNEKLQKSDHAKELEIEDLKLKRDETLELLDKAKVDLESEIMKYDKGLRRKERIIKESDNDRNDFGLTTCVVTPTTSNIIPNQHQPMNEGNENSGNKWGLNVVTQSLHIPPNSKNAIPTWEVKKLREDIRILRDFLKIRVHEKKNLLSQIAELNKRITMSRRSSLSSTFQANTPPPLREITNISCQTEEISSAGSHERNTLKAQLYAIADKLRNVERSSLETDKIVSDLRNIAANLNMAHRERRESHYSDSSSDWTGGLPDPSLIMPYLEFDDGGRNGDDERVYSLSNGRLNDPKKFSIYSMLEQFQPTDVDEHCEGSPLHQSMESLSMHEPAILSEDSWSQPDVSEARNRMGIPPLTIAATTTTNNSNNCTLSKFNNNSSVVLHLGLDDEKESDLNISQRTANHKSFYALEYTTQNLSNSDKEESSTYYLEYSDESTTRRHIIMESGLDDDDVDDDTSKSLVAEECIMGNCLKENLARIKIVMDSLSYEIDSTNSIDSDVTDEEDDIIEGEIRDRNFMIHSNITGMNELKNINIKVCYSCSERISKELQNSLRRSNTLLKYSTSTIRRLKRIIRHHEIHSEKSRDELNYTMNTLSELESSLLDVRNKSEETENLLRNQLEVKLKELEYKNKETQNIKTKLNENYNLVAQLSSENLSLSREKTRLEESLLCFQKIESSPEHCKKQYPLEKMNSSYRPLTNDSNGCWSMPQSKNTKIRSSNLRSSPETSSSFDFLSENASKNLNSFSVSKSNNANINNNNIVVPVTPPPLRLHRIGSRSSLRKKNQNRNSCIISEAEECTNSIGKMKETGKHFSSIGNLSGTSDISSPDLGVDMSSSDPFSSLERRCLSNSDTIGSIMHENYQLRRENKQLIEKLSRPISNFKDTMD